MKSRRLFMKILAFFVVSCFFSSLAWAQGLSVQSFDGTAKGAAQGQVSSATLGGDYQKQRQAGATSAPPYQDKPLATSQEYRGYNGRNLEQSFYRCKFESFRTAPPGDQNRGILEKMRIRMYIMDTCMNSEGFFRQKNSFGLDFNYLTSADFIVPTPK
jgi:hypothetical protein